MLFQNRETAKRKISVPKNHPVPLNYFVLVHPEIDGQFSWIIKITYKIEGSSRFG
jgi:hypothetical protein